MTMEKQANLLLCCLLVLASLKRSYATKHWEFGMDEYNSKVVFQTHGNIRIWNKIADIPLMIPPCKKVVYVRVNVDNIISTPTVNFDKQTNVVHIEYSLLGVSASTYDIIAKAVPSGDCSGSSYAPVSQPSYPPPNYPEQNYPQPNYSQPPYGQPLYAQPSYAQPSYAQPSYAQPPYAQPPYAQPHNTPPQYTQPNHPPPNYQQHSNPSPYYQQPNNPPSNYPQQTYQQPSHPQTDHQQPNYPQTNYQQPNYPLSNYQQSNYLHPNNPQSYYQQPSNPVQSCQQFDNSQQTCISGSTQVPQSTPSVSQPNCLQYGTNQVLNCIMNLKSTGQPTTYKKKKNSLKSNTNKQEVHVF